MNSLLKKISVESRKEQKTDFQYEVVHTMPLIQEDSSILGAIYDQNYHKSIVLGYALYNAHQAYFISYEDALKDQQFLDYLKNPQYHKYSYNIKAQILSAKWNGIEIQGMDFDLQLASYILNPSLKDEMKYIEIIMVTHLYNMKKKSLVKIRRNIFQRWIYLRNIPSLKLKPFMS